ncbi:MAG TPA: hypothetical protein PLF40_13025, partial [Kofleriaceae bacterium]|nr:hypothetical protein [Kofleriaceae bacterium]
MRLAGFTSMVVLVSAIAPSQAQAPTYAAQLAEAQATLGRAAAEKDTARQGDAWLQAAVQFGAIVPRKDISDGQRCDAVFNMLVAFRNSENVVVRSAKEVGRIDDANDEPKPQAIPERNQQGIGLVDTYLGAVPCHKADTTAEMLFFKANTLRRFAHNREAIPLYLEIVDKHRQHEVAEYAVNLLLDLYNRTQQYDDLIALAARISSDTAFLAKKDELRARLAMINNVAARKSVEALERTARTSKAPADFAKAADAYFQLYQQMRNAKPPGDRADEVLYNAGVAYESASDMR